jgi:hypothetical protein
MRGVAATRLGTIPALATVIDRDMDIQVTVASM